MGWSHPEYVNAAQDWTNAVVNPVEHSQATVQPAKESPRERDALRTAIDALQDHLDGNRVLDDEQLDQHKTTIEKQGKFLGGDEDTIRAAFNVVRSYDKTNGHLFVSGKTFKRVGENNHLKPPHTDIHWAVFNVMQQIMLHVYNADTVSRQPEADLGSTPACRKRINNQLDFRC